MCLNLTAQPEFIYRPLTFVCTECFSSCAETLQSLLRNSEKFTDVIVFYFTMGALIELQGGGANFPERGGRAVPVVSCGWALDQV